MDNLDDSNDINLLIGIPSGDTWMAAFGVSLAGLVSKYMTYKVRPDVRQQRLEIYNVQSSLLVTSRERVIREARKRECTHVLFLDSDMQFPFDSLHKLFARNRDFVGVNYARKVIPSQPTAASLDGELCYTDSHMEHCEEVMHIGLGLALLRLEAIQDLDHPFFVTEWNEEMEDHGGEDAYFCRKLNEHGVPIYVDHALSRDIGHIGRFRYDHSVVGEVIREPVEDNPREVLSA